MSKILIADDDAAIRKLLKRLLAEHGHRTFEAADGLDALHLARQEKPELVVTDVLMPVMDGFELVRQLRLDPITASVPVILISGAYNDAAAQALAAAGGATGVLKKPYREAELLAAIDAAMTGASHVPKKIPLAKGFESDHLRLMADKLTETATEADRRGAALRQSEREMQAFFEHALDAIMIIDNDGRYVRVNHAACELTGYSGDELLTLRVADLTPAGADSELREAWASFMAVGKQSGEWVLLRKDGTTVTVEYRAAANFEPGLHATVFHDISPRKRAEEALVGANAQLQKLSSRLFQVQEEERRHLAREIHDQIGQALTAARLNLETALQMDGTAMAEMVKAGLAVVEELLKQVQQISLDLRPPLLDDLGLVPALRWYLDRQAQRGKLEVEFFADEKLERMEAEIETACFRVAQEALTNVVRHAHAERVTVELVRTPDALHLTVRDNGLGFDVAAAEQGARAGKSLGLIGMRDRVSLLGGEVDCKSSPDGGTEIHAFFPLATPAGSGDTAR